MTSSLLISSYSHWYQKTKGLTGWWFQPPGKIWKSDWIIIPTIGENKKCSKPPTSYSSPVSAPHLGLLQHTLSSRGLEFLLRLDDGHGCHGESSLIYIYIYICMYIIYIYILYAMYIIYIYMYIYNMYIVSYKQHSSASTPSAIST